MNWIHTLLQNKYCIIILVLLYIKGLNLDWNEICSCWRVTIKRQLFYAFFFFSLLNAPLQHLISLTFDLVTQHYGILHVALGCWALLSFGPHVCRHYGSFTFFLIYLLGGISGNLISFLHTPEPTVGGTVSATFLSHLFF